MARWFWLAVSFVGVACLLALTRSTGEWRYLVGLPAFVFTMVRAIR